MLTKKQWKQALNELAEVPLFAGRYDAKNGNENYMHGIGSVIECMAYKAEDDIIYDQFLNNMILSKEKIDK